MKTSAVQRLAVVCARHPWRTLVAWGVALLLSMAAAALLLGTALTTEGEVTSQPESVTGMDLIEDRFPARDEVTEMVVVRSETGSVNGPSFRSTVAGLRQDIAAAEAVHGVGNPYADPSGPLVSADGSAVLLPVVMDDSGDDDPTLGIVDVVDAVERVDDQDAVAATITGEWTLGYDFTIVSQHDLEKGEVQFGLPAALVVLLVVFGAVVAALVPLSMAVASIVVAVGIASVVGQVTDLSFFIVNMVIAMGLALGIDYSLFITSRFREERYVGLSRLDAIRVSGATASKAVLFSGMSFVVALLGMLLVPDTVLRSLAFGAIVVGLVTVVAALTLLPATLALLGDRIERGRIPFVPRQHGGESPFWRRAVAVVTRHPVVTVVVTAGALIALSLPVLGLQTGSAGLTTLPDDTVSKRGFVALDTYFPEGSRTSPAQVVVDAPSSPAVTSAAERLQELAATDDSFGPATVTTAPGDDLTLVEVALTGDPAGDDATQAIDRLRDDYVPAAFDGVDGEVYVTGATAFNVDYASLIDTWLPIVIAFVLTLSFLLLLLMFRSVVLPLKAVVLNLLSVGAAYGLMVLVFQEGVGADLLGVQQIDRVEPWVPVFLFSVLFALSMDYHVFLLTRIRSATSPPATRSTRSPTVWAPPAGSSPGRR